MGYHLSKVSDELSAENNRLKHEISQLKNKISEQIENKIQITHIDGKPSDILTTENCTLKSKLDEQNALINMYKMKHQSCNAVKVQCTHGKINGILETLDEKSCSDIKVSKENYDYEYLVFSGGSIKGVSFIGNILQLEEYEMIRDPSNGKLYIKGFAGVSVGSIYASLLAIGYTGKEIEKIVMDLDMDDLFNDDLGYAHMIYNFIEKYGTCPGDYMLKTLGKLIKDKTGNEDYTIENLYKEKGIKLAIVATNDNQQCSVYFNPEHEVEKYRNIPIRKAIRASSAMPFIFQPYQYGGDFFSDGGILNNYPINIFDSVKIGDPLAELNLLPPNPKVLGFFIITADENINYTPVKRTNITSLYQYSTLFVDMLMDQNIKRSMTPSFFVRTIFNSVPVYSMTQMDLTQDQKRHLVDVGKQSTVEFFENKMESQ